MNAPTASREALLREALLINGELITGDQTIEIMNLATATILGRVPNREGGHEGLEEYFDKKLMIVNVPAFCAAT